MVKIQPLKAPEVPPTEPPTKFEFLEFLDQTYDWYNYAMENASIDYLYDLYYDYLDDNLEWFQSKKVNDYLSKSIFEEYFNGDWRKGHEFQKIVITHRLYQISPTATQA